MADNWLTLSNDQLLNNEQQRLFNGRAYSQPVIGCKYVPGICPGGRK
jgi:hypothetical protein